MLSKLTTLFPSSSLSILPPSFPLASLLSFLSFISFSLPPPVASLFSFLFLIPFSLLLSFLLSFPSILSFHSPSSLLSLLPSFLPFTSLHDAPFLYCTNLLCLHLGFNRTSTRNLFSNNLSLASDITPCTTLSHA